jgi:hypothetical protein
MDPDSAEENMKAEKMIGKKFDGYLVEEHHIRMPCPESVVGYNDDYIIGIKIQLSPDTYAILSWEYYHSYNNPDQNWMTWNLIGKEKFIISSFWQKKSPSRKELVWDNCTYGEKTNLIMHPLYHKYHGDVMVKVSGRGKSLKVAESGPWS